MRDKQNHSLKLFNKTFTPSQKFGELPLKLLSWHQKFNFSMTAREFID